VINLTPIAKEIQDRMFQKMRALSTHKSAPGTTIGNEKLTFDNMATRSPFIRMVSNQAQPVTLMGGKLKDNGSMYAGYDMYAPRSYTSGVAEQYDKSSTIQAGKLKTAMEADFEAGVSSKNNPDLYNKRKKFFDENVAGSTLKKTGVNTQSRPIPGIKSIDVSFKGGSRAMREATISWTCYDWGELDQLMPHFLAHGKTVLLEWGWVYGMDSLFNLPTLVDQNDKIIDDAFTDFSSRVIAGKGDFDVMVGVVKNFEFTTRSDGAFDCQTIISSVGVNLFSSPLSNPEAKDPGTQININRKETEKELAKRLQNAVGESDELGDVNIDNILTFDSNIGLKLFIKNINLYVIKQTISNTDTSLSTNKGRNNHFQQKSGGKHVVRWSPNKYIITRSNFTRSQTEAHIENVWVQWGWFEDNVLNKFLGMTNAKGDFIIDFKSVESNDVSVKIRNHQYLETTDINNHILPGQFKVQEKTKFGDIDVEGDVDEIAILSKVVNKNFTPFSTTGVINRVDDIDTMDALTFEQQRALYENEVNIAREQDGTRKATTPSEQPKPGRFGFLRNMLINTKIIKEAFGVGNGQDLTIESINIIESLEYMFDLLNQDLNLWSFEITTDSKRTQRAKIIDDSTTAFDFGSVKTAGGVYDKRTKEANGTVEEAGVFFFPTWQADSFIKSQTITAKIPNEMQLTTMYGSNMNAEKETTNPGKDHVDKEGVAAGAFYNTEPDNHKAGIDIVFKNQLNKNSSDSIIEFIKSKAADLEEPYQAKLNAIDETIQAQAKASREQEESDLGLAYDSSVAIPPLNFLTPDMKEQLLSFETDEKKEGFFNKLLNNKKTYADTLGSKFEPSGRMKKGFISFIGYAMTNLSSNNANENTMPIKIPFDLELEIDGTGGIFPGNSFHSTYLPSRYQQFALFQVFDISHKVDSNGWTSNITGKMRTTMETVVNPIPSGAIKKAIENVENLILKEEKKKEEATAKVYKKFTQTGKGSVSNMGSLLGGS